MLLNFDERRCVGGERQTNQSETASVTWLGAVLRPSRRASDVKGFEKLFEKGIQSSIDIVGAIGKLAANGKNLISADIGRLRFKDKGASGRGYSNILGKIR